MTTSEVTRLATYSCMNCGITKRPYGPGLGLVNVTQEAKDYMRFRPRIKCSFCKAEHPHHYVGTHDYLVTAETYPDSEKIKSVTFERARRIEVMTMQDAEPRFIGVAEGA